MITVNEAKAMVEKYNEEQRVKVIKEAERLANLASDKVEEAAHFGKTEISFEVVDIRVKFAFIDKFREAGFNTYACNDSEAKVVIKW